MDQFPSMPVGVGAPDGVGGLPVLEEPLPVVEDPLVPVLDGLLVPVLDG